MNKLLRKQCQAIGWPHPLKVLNQQRKQRLDRLDQPCLMEPLAMDLILITQ